MLTRAELGVLHETAREAARVAGRSLMEGWPVRDYEAEHKPDGGSSEASQVVSAADRRSQAIILEALEPTRVRHDLGLLTEELEDDGSRLRTDAFWCIDPLDGTLPFLQGTPGFAVSIALVRRDGTALLGVIHDPLAGQTWSAIRGVGTFLDGELHDPRGRNGGERLSVFGDRSFAAMDDFDVVRARLDAGARALGLDGVSVSTDAAAVLNAVMTLTQAPAVYFKRPKPERGGGCSWDFAATACLFEEAGAVVCDVWGEPLALNPEGAPFMNARGVLFASDRRVADMVRPIATGQQAATKETTRDDA